MKKIIIISTLAFLALACQKEPYLYDTDNEYLVYTLPDDEVDFGKFKTFNIADSILILDNAEKPEYSQSANAAALIKTFRTNMEKAGYIYNQSDPDLGIQLTYMVKSDKYVHYYENPYWWLDFPGYWSPGIWGDWYGFYYPRPLVFSYSTNALMADMVDLTEDDRESLEIIWYSYIGGAAGPSLSYDIDRMKDAIEQAFEQSPYLSRTDK